jgi:hypothetical protein
MESEGDSAQGAATLASFDSRRAAEHMLASLGRKFREKARKEGVDAFIVRGNPGGSLKLTQSRVLTAGGITSALVHVSFSLTVGFWGTVSMFKGLWRSEHAAHVRESHVGSDDRTAHAIPAKAGMALGQSFSPTLTLVPSTTGCAPLSVSLPGRNANSGGVLCSTPSDPEPENSPRILRRGLGWLNPHLLRRLSGLSG